MEVSRESWRGYPARRIIAYGVLGVMLAALGWQMSQFNPPGRAATIGYVLLGAGVLFLLLTANDILAALRRGYSSKQNGQL
jgi:sulfite exporter TauE/SafE